MSDPLKTRSPRPARLLPHAITTNTNHAQLLTLAAARRWKGTRTETTSIGMAEEVVRFLAVRGVNEMDAITSADMDALVGRFRAIGNSPQTMKAKLSTLGVMAKIAVNNVPQMASRMPPMMTIKHPKPLKWWLTEVAKDRLCAWLLTRPIENATDMADYIEWVVRTGMRLEETLRVRRSMFLDLGTGRASLTVPGKKTRGAQMTLPLASVAEAIAVRRFGEGDGSQEAPLFALTFTMLKDRWDACRDFLQVPQEARASATLKALRRTFARYATNRADPMPTETLQRYLRHSQIRTTLEYLHLVGSGDLEGMRKYL